MYLSVMRRRFRICQAVGQVASRDKGQHRGSTLTAIRLACLTQLSVNNPIFVICEPRSGSTLLCDYLNSHPLITCDHEILNRGAIPRLHSCQCKADLRFYLNTLFKTTNAEIVCGKIHFEHLEDFRIGPGQLIAWFPRARFLVLYRQSLLAQYVSLKLAQLTGRWIATRPDEESRQSINVDVAELCAFVEMTSNRYKKFVHLPEIDGRYLTISYEQLAGDAQRVFEERVWPFLGLPPAVVQTSLYKQNRLSLEKCVTNLREIQATVKDARITLE
jgi:LPS sulfotransferase NodH